MKRGTLIILGLFVLAILFWKLSGSEKRAAFQAQTDSRSATAQNLLKPKSTVRQRFAPAAEMEANSEPAELEMKYLSREQVEAYVQKVKRNAESLLNAFEETKDKNFLKEAAEKFPNDPRVQLAMLNEDSLNKTLSPEERKAWLERFKISSPQNAMPNYLSAMDNLKNGQTESALTELQSGAQKAALDCFNREKLQSREEMYLLAGLSPAEAKERAFTGLLLPLEAKMKRLSCDLADLEKNYVAAGDNASAQQIASLGIEMSRRWGNENSNPFLIGNLVGMAMENQFLKPLNPDTSYDFLGQTPGQRIQEMQDRKREIRESGKLLDQTVAQFSDSEKLAYYNRVQVYGERKAMLWFQQTYGTNGQ